MEGLMILLIYLIPFLAALLVGGFIADLIEKRRKS